MKLLFLFPLILIFFVALNTSAITSEVVAKIGKDVITSRRVLADTVLEANWTLPGSVKALSVQSNEFNTELNRFLMERVVYLESQSFSLISVKPAEVAKAKRVVLQNVKASGASSLWNQLAMTNDEVMELVKQKISSQKFIEFKSKASYVPVTEAEAYNYFQNNQAQFEGKEYKKIKEGIKRNLAKLQAQQRLEDWYDILKKKYDVTKIVSHIAE